MGMLILSEEMCSTDPTLTRKTSSELYRVIVPQTDTGRRARECSGVEIIIIKELGKIAP